MDRIGNLLCLNSDGPFNLSTGLCQGGRTLRYPAIGSRAPRPHAPVAVDGQPVRYTASGNLERLGDRVYRYDALDRLVAVDEDGDGEAEAEYVYTSTGQRIRSLDRTGPRSQLTYLLAPDFEYDATLGLSRTLLRVEGAVLSTVTRPFSPAAARAPPAAPAPASPVGPAVALILLLSLGLALAVQLSRLGLRGRSTLRPALAGGLSLVMLVATLPATLAAAPLDGDLNADGRVDEADALLAIEIATGQRTNVPSSMLESGDVAPLEGAPTLPSRIDEADSLLLLRAAQGEDVDGDGLDTEAELAAGASPFRRDTDRDGVDDPIEIVRGTDPGRAEPSGGSATDSDGDGLSDAAEVAAGTDPFLADTDGDGLPDGSDEDGARNGVAFHHGDQLSSTTLTTGFRGVLVQRVVYRPFGATVPSAAASAAETPRFGFTGQRFESGVGIYDYGARFYDPALGRFLQPDTVVPDPLDPQSLNRYSYVRNNPINRIDPTGNEDELGRFLASNTNRFLGGVQAGFGALAIAGGVAACSTGIGCVLGGPAIALGADNLATGVQAAITNEETDLVTSRFLQEAGAERDTANGVATFLDLSTGLAGGLVKNAVKEGLERGARALADDALEAASSTLRRGGSRLARGAAEGGGFARGITADEITAINRKFASGSTITGDVSKVLANAANQEGFFRKSASIIRDIAGTNLFVDGNGRTAQAVVEALASRNNVVSGPTSAGLRSVIQQVKTGQLSSVDDIAKALRGF